MQYLLMSMPPDEAPGGPLMDAESREVLINVLTGAGFKNVSRRKLENLLVSSITRLWCHLEQSLVFR